MVGFMGGIRYFMVAHVMGLAAFPSMILPKFHQKIWNLHFEISRQHILEKPSGFCSNQTFAAPASAASCLPAWEVSACSFVCWVAAAPDPSAWRDCHKRALKSHRRKLQEPAIVGQQWLSKCFNWSLSPSCSMFSTQAESYGNDQFYTITFSIIWIVILLTVLLDLWLSSPSHLQESWEFFWVQKTYLTVWWKTK